MSRRDLILDELGLAPRWRLREQHAAALQAQSDAEPAAALGSATPLHDEAARIRAADVSQEPAPEPALAQAGAPAAVDSDEARRRNTILALDWEGLKRAVGQCVACPLHAKRTNTVFGVGDERARWLFVGEGPGAEEDAKGEPFVGQAGRLLDNMLAAIELKRGEDVYIANVVKCRPPNNRNPEAAEMRCCEPYLARQIALIGPKLIVALGKIAASHLLRTDQSIASLRGRVHDYHGTPLIVTYHPAYLLRTLPDKAKSWADLCFARETMRALSAPQR